MHNPISLGVCVFAALAFQASDAISQDLNCPPGLGNVRVQGNLQVAARCELTGTEVRGNVILYAGGSLIGRDVRIRGNLEGTLADFVDLERSRVDGDVRLQELVGDFSSIERTEIHGSVLLVSNRFGLELVNNDVEGSVQVLGNRGGVLIAGNSVEQDLECADNVPAPLGIGNRVSGEMEGQCASLLAVAPQGPPPEPPATPPSPTTPTPSTPAPPAGTATDTFVAQPYGGGGGATGWPAALLLPLLMWRRFSRR